MGIFEHLHEEWYLSPDQEGAVRMATHIPLSVIAEDFRTHISNADQWLAKAVQEVLPQLVATAEKYENSPVVQALESVALSPEVEQQIAAIIRTLGKQFPPPDQPAEQPAIEGPVPDQVDQV